MSNGMCRPISIESLWNLHAISIASTGLGIPTVEGNRKHLQVPTKLTERPADFLDFRQFSIDGSLVVLGFGGGFGVWEGLQSIEACSEIHLDGFSAREVHYSSISDPSS